MSTRNSYIDVYFSTGQCISTTSEAWQYDHGLKLRIHGFASDSVPQIHYSNTVFTDAMSVVSTRESDCVVADIPDVLLTQSKEIQCYAYVENNSSGITVYEIHIPIRPRSKPKDLSFTPQQIDSYGQLVSNLNTVIDETEGIKSNLSTVTANAENATSEANAAAEKANTAAGSANTAAGVANTAASNANNAKDAANTAAGKANTAANRLSDVDMQVAMLPPSSEPTAEVVQTATQTAFKLGIPMSNLSYATFEVDENMELLMHSPDGFDGINFQINNGVLEVII